jgi:hypothetical protein
VHRFCGVPNARAVATAITADTDHTDNFSVTILKEKTTDSSFFAHIERMDLASPFKPSPDYKVSSEFLGLRQRNNASLNAPLLNVRNNNMWTQEAYVKAVPPSVEGFGVFGYRLGLEATHLW